MEHLKVDAENRMKIRIIFTVITTDDLLAKSSRLNFGALSHYSESETKLDSD
jgi:hypothetical protein